MMRDGRTQKDKPKIQSCQSKLWKQFFSPRGYVLILYQVAAFTLKHNFFLLFFTLKQDKCEMVEMTGVRQEQPPPDV